MLEPFEGYLRDVGIAIQMQVTIAINGGRILWTWICIMRNDNSASLLLRVLWVVGFPCRLSSTWQCFHQCVKLYVHIV